MPSKHVFRSGFGFGDGDGYGSGDGSGGAYVTA